jgi:YgiT-type zinc finger domain-containing protein
MQSVTGTQPGALGPNHALEHLCCPECNGTNVTLTKAHSAFWEGERLIVIEGLPSLYCPDCREHFFEDYTATMLDILRGRGFPTAMSSRKIEALAFDFDRLLRHSAANDARGAS